LFFVLCRLLLKKGDVFFSWRAVVSFCSAPVAGFLVHLAQNAWYFGGITGALDDFGKSAADRMLHSADAPMSGFGLKVWWSEVIVRYFSGVMIFNLFVIGCLCFFAYIMYYALPLPRRKPVRALLRLLCVLAACGLTWYILFPAHSFAHMYVPFLYRHIVPAAALGFSIVVFELFYFLKQRGAQAVLRIAVCCACVILIGWSGISRSDLPLTGRALIEARDFLLFKRDLLRLRTQSRSGDEIGVNYYRRPFISYYTERRTFFFPDGKSLAQREKLPRYFLFFPFNHQATGELYAFLQQKYRVLFTSESRMFPVVFYELNS
jgi:hypothetical protein